jgi:hypothetical protein
LSDDDSLSSLASTLRPVSIDQRAALLAAACVVEAVSSDRELQRTFVAVDWFIRSIIPIALEQRDAEVSTAFRRLPALSSSFPALCAMEICDLARVRLHDEASRELIDEAVSSAKSAVWAEAAHAADLGLAHPLAPQALAHALSGSFSNARDFPHEARTGEAIGRGVRLALGVGVQFELVREGLKKLYVQLSAT